MTSEQEWPPVLLGRLQRMGDVEYFDVPEDDADEYETQRYVPDTVLEELRRAVRFEVRYARNLAAATRSETAREHLTSVADLLDRALQERGG